MTVQRIGHQVLSFDILSSTNDHAATLANDPNAAGTVVIARAQTAGRGQYGRSWHAPAGAGVWMSVILKPPPELLRPLVLTAFTAVSVIDLVESATGLSARIKWPNDVLIAGKKVCGILIEQKSATIIGIGLNVNQSGAEFAAANLPDAASLASLSGQRFDVDDLATRLIASLNRRYSELVAGNMQSLEAHWCAAMDLVGRAVEAELADGRTVTGTLSAMSWQEFILQLTDGASLKLRPEQIRHIFSRNG